MILVYYFYVSINNKSVVSLTYLLVCPWQELNLHQSLRTRLLYPLSYRGIQALSVDLPAGRQGYRGIQALSVDPDLIGAGLQGQKSLPKLIIIVSYKQPSGFDKHNLQELH